MKMMLNNYLIYRPAPVERLPHTFSLRPYYLPQRFFTQEVYRSIILWKENKQFIDTYIQWFDGSMTIQTGISYHHLN